MANTITVGTLADLQVKIPVEKTSGWATDFRDEFVRKIVEHNHSGENGQGRKIGAGSLANDIVTDQEIRLRNDEFLRARNAADDGDVDILKVNGSDVIELASALGTLSITPVSADPISPEEGQIQISDGTARPAGLYTYVGGSWLAAPNNVTASNQGTGESLFIQKTGDDLEFKSVTSSNIYSITSTSNELNIDKANYKKTKILENNETLFSGNVKNIFFSYNNGDFKLNTKYKLKINFAWDGGALENFIEIYPEIGILTDESSSPPLVRDGIVGANYSPYGRLVPYRPYLPLVSAMRSVTIEFEFKTPNLKPDPAQSNPFVQGVPVDYVIALYYDPDSTAGNPETQGTVASPAEVLANSSGDLIGSESLGRSTYMILEEIDDEEVV